MNFCTLFPVHDWRNLLAMLIGCSAEDVKRKHSFLVISRL